MRRRHQLPREEERRRARGRGRLMAPTHHHTPHVEEPGGILGSRTGEILGSGTREFPRGEVGGPVTGVDCQAWELCRPWQPSPPGTGSVTTAGSDGRGDGAGAGARSGDPGAEDGFCVDHLSGEEASRGSEKGDDAEGWSSEMGGGEEKLMS